MVDWLGAKYAGKWNRLDRYLLLPVFAMVFMPLFLILMVFFTKNIFGKIMYILCALIFIPMFFFVWGIYKQRKGMWIKLFNYDDNTVVRVIENMLKQNNISYNKLKGQTQEYIVRFPLKYAEIFEIPQYQISIKIQKQMATGSAVEVGPIGPNNEMYIENMKKGLDNAFIPRGL